MCVFNNLNLFGMKTDEKDRFANTLNNAYRNNMILNIYLLCHYLECYFN